MIDQALHAAVTISRNEQIRSVRALQTRLRSHGFTDEEIAAAVWAWAQYYHAMKTQGPRP